MWVVIGCLWYLKNKICLNRMALGPWGVANVHVLAVRPSTLSPPVPVFTDATGYPGPTDNATVQLT